MVLINCENLLMKSYVENMVVTNVKWLVVAKSGDIE